MRVWAIRGIWGRILPSVFGCVLVSGLLVSAPAHAAVTPQITCATFQANNNYWYPLFGYSHPGPEPVVLPIGPQNVFTPGTPNRGQPTTFLPGTFGSVFRGPFQKTALVNSVTWSLDGSFVTVNDSGTFPSCSVNWAGTWRSGIPYFASDLVVHDGNAWIATRTPVESEPGDDTDWQKLVDFDESVEGPTGPTGPAGPTGPQGPRGAPGPPAENQAFPSSRTYRFSKKGRRPIRDPHVKRSSVVIIQYVGRGGKRPTSVARQRRGSFVAIGSPRRAFRYVIFD